MTIEDHLRAALKRSRRAHKSTIAQAKMWKHEYRQCRYRLIGLKDAVAKLRDFQLESDCLPERKTVALAMFFSGVFITIVVIDFIKGGE